MSSAPLRSVVEHLRRTVAPGDAVGDAELLDRFVRRRDEAAFELLVRRHERLVLGVCRRVLRHVHDADDAFQATFLLLARKAATISDRRALAPWLHRVALRVSLHARAARRPHEPLDPDALGAGDDPSASVVWRDLRPVLDGELCRLPEQYRAAVVLCDLDGRTYAEAARQLGCSRAAVWARLARGRELLRRRLVRRGVALSGAALAIALTRAAARATPPALLESTLAVVAGATASVPVAALTKGVLHAMFLSKVKTITAATLAAVTAAGLSLAVASRGLEAQQPRHDPDPPAQVGKSERARNAEPPGPKPPPESVARGKPPAKDESSLDDVLERWQKRTAGLKQLSARLVLDGKEKRRGTFQYVGPGRYAFEGMDGPAGVERIQFDGDRMYLFDSRSRTVLSRQLPRGPGGQPEALSAPVELLVFALTGENDRLRRDLRLAKEDQYYVYLEVLPAPGNGDGTLRARVVLDREKMLARQVWVETVNGSVVWDVLDVDTDPGLKAEEFRKVSVPSGWTLREMGAETKPPAPPPSAAAPARPGHDHLDALVKELAAGSRSNEQAVEALFLAALGRFPTDTERALMLDTLASQKDRQQALARVLDQLTGTKEFAQKAEALSKRQPPKPGY